jgi:dTDP-4-dehydrorhamnose reductase
VHYSTDFVFDGLGEAPYTEYDATNPVNAYGRSKLAGEQAVRRGNSRHYILRVESLFGGDPRSGARTTVDFFAESFAAGRTVSAAVDRTVSPSYVPDVVTATLALSEGKALHGTYHCVASGQTTWFELAKEIASMMGGMELVTPVCARDLPCRAARPQYCALSNEKLRRHGIAMPTWQAALRSHLANHPAVRRVA